MGCISSKFLVASDLPENISNQHVVSLTSTTYGVLNIDRKEEEEEDDDEDDKEEEVSKEKEKQISNATKVSKISPLPSSLLFTPLSKKRLLKEEPSEIINTWELMKDLNSDSTIWSPAMKPNTKPPTPKSTSSKKQKKSLLGKENVSPKENNIPSSRILRPFSSSSNRQSPKLVIDAKARTLVEKDSETVGSRRSLSPLFNPDIVSTSKKHENASVLLDSYEKKCPPSGENALVLYSTTLRGIRKTFEDCNAVRSLIEAYDVKIVERDISMDSGFKEELRVLMGKMTVTPPLLFVKGRLIGGAEEVLKLEDEGKLGLLLDGIVKKDSLSCDVCGGMKFVMCRKCNGSCKVMDEVEKKMVKCGECNENGLIHCSLCC